MDQNKKQVLYSILIGKSKVDERLKEVEKLEEQMKEKLDFNAQNEFRKSYEQFQVNLYNFYRSIKCKKDYFADYNKLELLINKPIILKTYKKPTKNYSLGDLLNAFRNRNEHYDKIDREEEYILFRSSITKEQLIELYNCCIEVLNTELNKLDEIDIFRFILANAETKSSLNLAVMNAIESNERDKEKFPNIYRPNIELIELLKNVNLDTISVDEFEELYSAIKKYLTCEEYKDGFIERYGTELYNHLLNIYETEDSSFEDDKKKIEYFYNKIFEIEKNLKSDD